MFDAIADYISRHAWSWASLRSVGNSKIVQLSAIFPFIGYLILFNDEVAKFLSMAGLDNAPTGRLFDNLWRQKLYFLYFGLMFTGVASTVYQVWCPYLVKKHGDWADYVRIDGDSLSDAAAESLGTALGRNYAYDCMIKNSDNVTMDYMREWYSEQSNDKPFARFSVTVFFGAGFFLLAIPSMLSAIKVATSILNKIS